MAAVVQLLLSPFASFLHALDSGSGAGRGRSRARVAKYWALVARPAPPDGDGALGGGNGGGAAQARGTMSSALRLDPTPLLTLLSVATRFMSPATVLEMFFGIS